METNHNIAQAMVDIANRFPERPGLVDRDGSGYRSWTLGEMNQTSDWFAADLAERGVKRGDRVMLMVKPSLEFICLTFALFKIGAVIILIDPGMGYKNLLKCIGQVRPEVFIGIAKAHLFKFLFPKPFKTVRINVRVGSLAGFFGFGLNGDQAARSGAGRPFPVAGMKHDDLAAILFTTGSTGPPKGVRYEHGIFNAQLKLIRDYYGITQEDIDQPAFPLFALFATALGACVVIPDMDPARPARVDPARFVRTIIDHQVTYSFGSPAIWDVVSRYCRRNGIRLASLRKVLMAGAPVPGDLIGRVKGIMAPGGEIHTPYGATESLPITSMTGSEILAETWEMTRVGKGVCVGRPLPGIDIRIISISDQALRKWDESLLLPVGQIGEIVARGVVVTRAYDNNEPENLLAKIADHGTVWHRLGDTGYLDEQGRLWFCGRRAHRVMTANGTLFSVCCEAIFNEHPAVFRSALVGVGDRKNQQPVLIVQPHEKVAAPARFFAELKDLGKRNPVTSTIDNFLIHPNFPVDIRHNAKIFREKLAVWAASRLRGQVQ